VSLIFALVMVWLRRSRDVLEANVAHRTAELSAANDDLRGQRQQLAHDPRYENQTAPN
jgi:hypothetical protein